MGRGLPLQQLGSQNRSIQAHGIPCYLLSKFKRLRFSTFRQREWPKSKERKLKARLGVSTCSGFVFSIQMLLKETIHKTNTLFHKTLENFKHLFFKGFQKLQKPTSFIPFPCSKGNPQHTHPTDRIYIDFYDEWQSTLHKAAKRSIERGSLRTSNENMKQEENTNVAEEEKSPPRSRQEKTVKEKKKAGNAHFRKGDVKSCSTRSDGLVQKMKELEMLDRGDMEQELDIEEAIHYYSRLRSPVYLEIVDKFFMDIHSEFSVAEPSAKSMNSSKRRMGSMRL